LTHVSVVELLRKIAFKQNFTQRQVLKP